MLDGKPRLHLWDHTSLHVKISEVLRFYGHSFYVILITVFSPRTIEEKQGTETLMCTFELVVLGEGVFTCSFQPL